MYREETIFNILKALDLPFISLIKSTIMKLQVKFCLLGILFFAFSSCSKDENNINSGSIIGQWRMTDIHIDDGVSETTFLGQTINATFNSHGTDYNTTTTFTENPNEFSSEGSYTVITNLIILGQTTSDTSVVDAYTGTGTWSINGNKMTQIFAGDTSTFDILELSDIKMRLKEKVNTTVQDTSLGLIIHEEGTVFSTFENQ